MQPVEGDLFKRPGGGEDLDHDHHPEQQDHSLIVDPRDDVFYRGPLMQQGINHQRDCGTQHGDHSTGNELKDDQPINHHQDDASKDNLKLGEIRHPKGFDGHWSGLGGVHATLHAQPLHTVCGACKAVLAQETVLLVVPLRDCPGPLLILSIRVHQVPVPRIGVVAGAFQPAGDVDALWRMVDVHGNLHEAVERLLHDVDGGRVALHESVFAGPVGLLLKLVVLGMLRDGQHHRAEQHNEHHDGRAKNGPFGPHVARFSFFFFLGFLYHHNVTVRTVLVRHRRTVAPLGDRVSGHNFAALDCVAALVEHHGHNRTLLVDQWYLALGEQGCAGSGRSKGTGGVAGRTGLVIACCRAGFDAVGALWFHVQRRPLFTNSRFRRTVFARVCKSAWHLHGLDHWPEFLWCWGASFFPR
mmetsp:Transcript_65864/g.109829  ORF Transcript_65864/g.109829 Transcript_65864/m.109829 type:complete len:413 (+) Transcript_65864:816-2054(+)